jgi:hypothetical protein
MLRCHRETRLTLPELAFIAETRGLVELGVGLPLVNRFAASHRKTVGWTLLAVDALSTIPLELSSSNSSQVGRLYRRIKIVVRDLPRPKLR